MHYSINNTKNKIIINLDHGFKILTETYEEEGKKYNILEVYKDGEIQFFDEVEI